LDEFFYEKHKPLDIQESLKQLEEFLPYTSAFVIIGGEPLLIDAHYKFLDGLIESGHADQICLSYTSNLTMSVDKFNTYVDKFKDVRMSASIDGLGERNDWIRYGSKFQTIIDNMGKLKCTKQVYYTTSVLSVFQCNEADKYFKSIGAPVEDFIIVDSFLSVRHMPHELKLELLDDIHIPSVREELKKPRDEKQWQKAMNYISDLDKTRKIKAKDIFDEIVPYLRDS
jgi:sulfatase maturation enzyme AslB (radical SAM superfamily)